MQVRIGPNRVGPLAAAAVRHVFAGLQEVIVLTGANKFLFLLGSDDGADAGDGGGRHPILARRKLADVNAGLLYVMASRPWASTAYHRRLGVELEVRVLGAMRSAAQIVATRSPWGSGAGVLLVSQSLNFNIVNV
jgi:NADH:ubiquinone oxidoreductase subunit H